MCWEYTLKGYVSPPLITSLMLGGCMGLRWLHLICRLGSSFVFKWMHNFSVCLIVLVAWRWLLWNICVNSVISAQFIYISMDAYENKYAVIRFPILLYFLYHIAFMPYEGLCISFSLELYYLCQESNQDTAGKILLLFCFVKLFVQVNATLKMTWENYYAKEERW